MNKPLAIAVAVLTLCCGAAHAQGLRLAAPKTLGAALSSERAAQETTALPADHIVALVNSEPVTNNEVRARMALVLSTPDNPAAQTPRQELMQQVLENLILERAQIQAAAEQGIKVDDALVNQAEDSVARQNNLTPVELRERLKKIGVEYAQFRANIRNEVTLQRIRERVSESAPRVREQDIDAYLADKQTSNNLSQLDLNLGQILIKVPENASAADAEALRRRAQEIAQRARSGENFASLAREFSEGAERNSGGAMGLRNAERYPTLFTDAVGSLKTGDVAGPLRSGAGFHVLKVLEKRSSALPDTEYTQTRARHILLRTGPQLSQSAAIARLNEVRQRLLSGQAQFDDMARQVSQDGSASAGGDLGWANPGQFVPEFEQVMNSLAPNQVSEPVVSRFGVHLIQVTDRRQAQLTGREQREWVRNILREQKGSEAYESWVRDARARAYVEYREPPQ